MYSSSVYTIMNRLRYAIQTHILCVCQNEITGRLTRGVNYKARRGYAPVSVF